MYFMEMREISVVIPVLDKMFLDDKEVSELFKYVFEKSKLYTSLHPPFNLMIEHANNGEKIFSFTLRLRGDDKAYDLRKEELELLVNSYDIHEREYLRFRKFGDIESGALIRKGTK